MQIQHNTQYRSSRLPSDGNSNRDCKDGIFSHLLLKEIFMYTCWRTTLSRMIDLSLISKSVFKIIQSIHTHYQHQSGNYIKLDYLFWIIGVPYKVGDDIKPPRPINQDNYHYNLFQYKEVISFRLDYGVSDKETLIKYCPMLENIHLLFVDAFNDKWMKEITNGNDSTLKTFYTTETLHIYYDFEKPPLEDGETDEEFDYDNDNVSFSFSIVDLFSPEKVSLQTAHSDMELQIQILDPLLEFKSIKSIKTSIQTVTYEMINNIFKSNTITSLCAFVDGEYDEHNGCMYRKEFIFDTAEFNQNTTLKQLSLQPDYNSFQFASTKLNELKGNHTLEILGLDMFRIKSVDDLNPLLTIPNIHTIEIHRNEDTTQQQYIIEHIKLNRNLREVHWFGYNKLKESDIKGIIDSNSNLQAMIVWGQNRNYNRYTKDGKDNYYYYHHDNL